MRAVKVPRPSTEMHRLALKSASAGAIRTAGGGDCFALATRIEAPRLSQCGNPQIEGTFLPIDVALDADLAAGAPIITAALAHAQGFALVPLAGAALPAIGHAGLAAEALGFSGLSRLTRELGDVAPALLTALADGTLTAAEQRAALDEIDQASAALTAARAALAICQPGAIVPARKMPAGKVQTKETRR